MSLKGKFMVMVAVAAAGLLALGGVWLKSQRSGLLSERLAKTKNLVEIPYSVIAQQYRLESQGRISRKEAQRRALEAIRPMRYQGDNYFWVNDLHPTMLMHPTKPELEGKDLTDFKDPKGKAMFVEFVNASKTTDGGYVFYQWPKPGGNTPVDKISFVKQFEPWGWVVGTGVYIEDIDAAWLKSGVIAGSLGLGCLIALVLVSTNVSRSIFRRLHDMVHQIKDVAEGQGDLTKRLEVSSNDEVAELARWFNVLMDRLHQILSQVNTSTQSLASASEQISASSRTQAQGAETQKDQTSQVATAMQEMAATVQQVSENSNSAAAASRKAAETARQGGKVVEETLSRMRAIADSVGETAKKVQELGKRSD